MTPHHHWIPLRVSAPLGCLVLLAVLLIGSCVAHGSEPVDYGTLPRVSYAIDSPPTPTAAPAAAITYAPPPGPVYYLVGGRLYASPPSHYPPPAFGSGTACVPGGG